LYNIDNITLKKVGIRDKLEKNIEIQL